MNKNNVNETEDRRPIIIKLLRNRKFVKTDRIGDLLLTFRPIVNLVESVFKQGDGHEALALFRGRFTICSNTSAEDSVQ